MEQFKPLLKTREVAALLNCSTASVRNWVYAGKLTALRTGSGSLRFRSEDLEEFLTPTDYRIEEPGGRVDGFEGNS